APPTATSGAESSSAAASTNPPSPDGARGHQPSAPGSQANGSASDPSGATAAPPAQSNQSDGAVTNDTQGGASTDQSSDATAPATDVGDVAKAINALLKALQRAGFTSAAGTSGDMAATGTDDGSPLSQLMGKLAKALAALEKDEKKGVAPSKDDL